MKEVKPKKRIPAIISCLNEGMHEREEIIAVALLAALAGQSAFLLGPPGTAKSLIARRISCAFSDKAFFSYLMHKFSTPEEVFGPISIKELKEDNYIRKPEGFLPTADFAFLDEIWKAGPAILNTLLTIVNERIFRNGTKEAKVPLKALIAASNETPPEGQGLEALYDRFIVRLHVLPMQENENFEKLLHSEPADAEVKIPDEYTAIKNNEWDEWRECIQMVDISPETIQVVKLIKANFIEKNKSEGENEFEIYVSDRRWQKAMTVIRAAAFFCERDKTNLADTLLLRHCLWTSEENRKIVMEIVEKAVKNSGFKTEKNINSLMTKQDKLEKEIKEELYYSEDIYDTVEIGGKEYFKRTSYLKKYRYNEQTQIIYYVPYKNMKTNKEFHPVDDQKNPLKDLICNFNGRVPCSTKIEGNYITIEGEHYSHFIIDGERVESVIYTPAISFHKGDKRTVNPRLIEELLKAILELDEEFRSAQKEVEERLVGLHSELETPFVPENVCAIAVESIDRQLDEIKIAVQDCRRLQEMVKK